MEPWRGLHGLTVLCLLMHARGQRDFDLADALDDPEPTKKPNSGYFNDGDRNDGHYPPRPRPRPPAVIYPTLKPRPQPQPGNSGNSGGYFNDGDRNDGHYPPRPRPRPPAERGCESALGLASAGDACCDASRRRRRRGTSHPASPQGQQSALGVFPPHPEHCGGRAQCVSVSSPPLLISSSHKDYCAFEQGPP
ncbi:glycoprotein Xg [Aotus nancymaae]|uniref:glycoprotein Xg n=1 Tax=Aotus nancymaae TaxID=37293 RepID=UPI0030FE228D